MLLGAVTASPVSAPQGGGTSRHVTALSPKGQFPLDQHHAQLPPVCTWPDLGATAHSSQDWVAKSEDPQGLHWHLTSAWLPVAIQLNGSPII